jgi:chromosome segregation ATPase
MCKKLCVTTLAVVIGLGLLSQTKVGRHIFSLGGLTWNKVSNAVGDSVPLDVEIARINHEIDNLSTDISKSLDILAKQKVDVGVLTTKVEELEKQLTADLDKTKTLKAMLDKAGDSKTVSYKGTDYDVAKIRAQFASSWDLYKSRESTLENHKHILTQKKQLMEATQAKIEKMDAVQEQLRGKIVSLKAKLEKVRLAETVSPVQVDDSRLADIKADIANLEKRIEERAVCLELEQKFGP